MLRLVFFRATFRYVPLLDSDCNVRSHRPKQILLPVLRRCAIEARLLGERARLGRSQRRPRRWHGWGHSHEELASCQRFGARARRTTAGATVLPILKMNS